MKKDGEALWSKRWGGLPRLEKSVSKVQGALRHEKGSEGRSFVAGGRMGSRARKNRWTPDRKKKKVTTRQKRKRKGEILK